MRFRSSKTQGIVINILLWLGLIAGVLWFTSKVIVTFDKNLKEALDKANHTRVVGLFICILSSLLVQ